MKLKPDQKKWLAWIIMVLVTTALSVGLGVTYPTPAMPDVPIPLGITNFDDLTLGEADETDTTILFDGNAQDFYISLDDTADDLLIGLGSAVGTTPGIGIDENLAVTTYGDLTFGGTTPVVTVGDAGAEDTAIVFDGNAQDFYIALDDTADDLVIGLGSAVGTTPGISVDENQLTIMHADALMTGTTPLLTIGDAGAEDTTIVFDGNAQDFYMALDDTADDLLIGLGSAVGTTPALAIDENLVTTWTGGTIALTEITTATDTLTASECGKTIFLNSATEYTTTLPAISTVSAGCEFRVIVKAAPASASYVVITGNSDEDVLIGGINELDVDTGDDGPYDANGDTITFVDGTAVVGDFVYMISDGSFFYVSGQANADGGVTIADSD